MAARCCSSSSSSSCGTRPAATRRGALRLAAAAPAALLAPRRASAAAGGSGWTAAPGGIEYKDVVVGTGAEAANGDYIKVVFSAFTYDPADPDARKGRHVFDPFVLGGGGASASKGFKLALGGINGDIIPGWNDGIVGTEGVPAMRAGGTRVLRLPPELAFGDDGHHCRQGYAQGCEVPPGTPVEITTQFVDFV